VKLSKFGFEREMHSAVTSDVTSSAGTRSVFVEGVAVMKSLNSAFRAGLHAESDRLNSLNSFQGDGVPAHAEIIVRAMDSNLILGLSSVSLRELGSQLEHKGKYWN